MTLTGEHLIDGTWHASVKRFVARNPSTGDVLQPDFYEASEKDVDAALAAASRAFDASSSLDPRWPAQLLEAVGDRIMDLGDALLERAEQETALPRARLTMERGRTVSQLKMFAQVVRDGAWLDATIDTADPGRTPVPKPDVRRVMRPRGPAVVFGASNFPFAFSVLGGDTASALAAGNPVIVKGHPSHPGTSELFARAMLAAIDSLDLPRGLFALLQGTTHDLGGALVKHPATAAVGFTGSQRAGRALFDLAAARPKPVPVYAEMGSLNPLVVMPGAIRDRGDAIAKALAGSVLLGGGQFCTKPGVVIVGRDSDAFVEKLSTEIAASAPVTMLNAPLRENFIKRVEAWSRIKDVRARIKSTGSGFAAVTPSLFETSAGTFVRERELREEAFGPAALVVRCETASEMELVIAVIGGSLTGTVHVGTGDDARPILDALAAVSGRVVIDGYPTGVEVCHAMVHSGPYPATTDAATTSVGSAAIRRFARMVAYQNTPDALLPPALRNANPMKVERTVNGRRTSDAIR